MSSAKGLRLRVLGLRTGRGPFGNLRKIETKIGDLKTDSKYIAASVFWTPLEQSDPWYSKTPA